MLAVVAAATIQSFAATQNSTTSIDLPAPYSRLGDGPNKALAQGKCLICHSSDYIYSQPPLSRPQWTAEVTKMKNAYAAPLTDADIPLLVDYLMSQNGKV